jgi:glycerol-3-phosphate acyltransferase PlsY
MKQLDRIKSWHLGVINLLGVVLSFFYGITGGSGGETTEGVFMGIFLTGIISMCLCVLFLVVGGLTRRITWVDALIVVAVMAVSYLETTIYNP